jgi:hypothetical protein
VVAEGLAACCLLDRDRTGAGVQRDQLPINDPHDHPILFVAGKVLLLRGGQGTTESGCDLFALMGAIGCALGELGLLSRVVRRRVFARLLRGHR